MSVLRAYNPSTSQWESIAVGGQGPAGAGSISAVAPVVFGGTSDSPVISLQAGSTGNLLTYNGTRWINTSVVSPISIGGTTSAPTLGLSAGTANQVLTYDGSSWTSASINGGSVTRATLSQLRRDTAANWTSSNPVLAAGEIGFETDTNKFKIGDGTTAWTSRSYAANQVGSTSGLMVQTTTGGALSTLAAGTTSQFLRGDGSWQAITGFLPSSGGTLTGTVSGVSPTSAGSNGFRNITISTSAPSGGSSGDIWFVYV
jgi:Major tropism determinant N-terminal domain